MHRTIHYSFVVGILLIHSGFGVFSASAKIYDETNVVSAQATIQNNVSAEANSGNNSSNGTDGNDGADGKDGADGLDGHDGKSKSSNGDAQASVKVVNVVDGEELVTSTIDIKTSSDTDADVQKQQLITSDDGSTVIQNTISVITSDSTANDTDDVQIIAAVSNHDTEFTNTSEKDDPDAQKSKQVSPIFKVFIAAWSSVVAFFSGLFNLF